MFFRFNDPERMTPATPQAKDLGQTVRLLADDIRTFGLELIRLGAEFHRDPNFAGDDAGKEKFRRLIQVFLIVIFIKMSLFRTTWTQRGISTLF